MYQECVEKNLKESQAKCKQILKKLYTEIGAREAQGEFTKRGGHEAYKTLIKDLEQKYDAIPEEEKGPLGQQSLIEFRNEVVLWDIVRSIFVSY